MYELRLGLLQSLLGVLVGCVSGPHLLQRKVFADEERELYWSVGVRTSI